MEHLRETKIDKPESCLPALEHIEVGLAHSLPVLSPELERFGHKSQLREEVDKMAVDRGQEGGCDILEIL